MGEADAEAFKKTMGGNMTDLSGAADKLRAVLNHAAANPDDDLGGSYRAACRAWFARLTEGEQWIVAAVAKAHAEGREADAEQIAAKLPPAPRCPL